MKRTILAAVAFAAMLSAAPVMSQTAVPGAAYTDEIATAIALANGGRYGDAVQVLTTAAEGNNVDAQVMLGLVYLHGSFVSGQEVKMDLVAASYWFSRAAASGSPIAEFLLVKVNAMSGGAGVTVIQAPMPRYNQK
jgi:TPR repeat protein